MYTDPSGEIIPLIIVGAALIGSYVGGAIANGGEWNPGKWNWSSSDTWIGIGGGAIIGGVSAGVGIAVTSAVGTGYLATAIGSMAGGFVNGAFSSLLPGGSGNFWEGGAIGAVSGFAGGSAGHLMGKVSNVMINGINVTSPLLKSLLGGAMGGLAGGYIGGFTAGYIKTGDFSLSHKMATQSSVVGVATGSVMGVATGYANARAQGIDFVSGKLLAQPNSTIVRHHTNIENMNSIKNSKMMFPSRLSEYDFYGVDFEGTPIFDGNQNFGTNKGAFIEMRLPSEILTPSPVPTQPYYYRVNTGYNNFNIQQSYSPQYYRNYYFKW